MIENYRLAFEIAPVPMLLATQDGLIVLVNARFLELFEYTEAELINQPVEILVPAAIRERHPALRAAYHRVPTKRGMGVGRDLHGVTRSGNVVPLELALEPVVDEDVTYALVVAIDISQRKATEARVHLAMDAAASAMVMVNEQQSIVYANKAAANLFGYAHDGLIGRPVDILVPDAFKVPHPVFVSSYFSSSMARPMADGKDLYARHKDGSLIPVDIALTPIETPDEKLIMSTIIDLSERVAAGKAIEQRNHELAALNVELSQFAYSASHDLKAPLSSLTGLLRFCLEDLSNNELDQLEKNLKTALDVSLRSAGKIEGVLRIARSGSEEIDLEAVQLAPLVQEIWADLTAGRTKTVLETGFHHPKPLMVERPTIKLILENLLSNALRFGDDNKAEHRITVTSRAIDGDLELVVSDNGVGIADENKPKVFEMFTRIDQRSGDGLGLSLVKKQIDRLSGSITLESKLGEGTSFAIQFPLAGGR